MPKGPEFLKGNARRHEMRMGRVPLLKAEADALAIRLGVENARERGLTYEERLELKRRISEIQKPKEKRERLLDDRDARAKRRQGAKAMPGPGLFICGCNPQDEHIKRYYTNVEPDGQGGQRLTFKRRDQQGREVCPIHGKNMYGFASTGKDEPPQDYQPAPIELKPSVVTDRRDARDPAEVGAEELARRAAARNGHETALEGPAPMVRGAEGGPDYPSVS